MPIEIGTQSFIDSDGRLTSVPDIYKNVTQSDVQRAEEVEQALFASLGTIEAEYIKIGACLVVFEDEKLYVAKGLPTFSDWLQSDVKISKRLAHDLMRIVREALPALLDQNAMDILPNVSTMRALLPVLADGPEKFVQAAREVQGLTIQDTYAKLKELKGVPDQFDHIKLFVRNMGHELNIRVVHVTNVETFQLGQLTMSNEEWRLFSRHYSGPVENV